jgi:chromosome segregation protein
MYLKRLEIQGFKSFADKIKLNFNKGITAVVGPNGSGKSNIGEAIRWVLGEQSAKILRGNKMEDVIFVGTEFRKPLGFAEVSITIDNADGKLPFEYTEVTATRRVYRSGESEYMINRTKCRLKDLQTLFMDTGIGKDGYSIIGQGRIDEILSSKSEDRRLIFEEASGIVKYKTRKIESERKLEKTEENLTRINDILSELEYQLVPLKEQSEKAKSFLEYRNKLNEIEINLFVEQITKNKDTLVEMDNKFNVVKDDIDKNQKDLEIFQEEIDKLSEKIKTLDTEYEVAIKEFYSIETEMEKINSNIELNDEKIKNCINSNTKIENEKGSIGKRISGLKAEKEEKLNKLNYLNENLDKYSNDLNSKLEEFNNLIGNLDESEKHIEDLKQGILDKINVQSDKKLQINNMENHIKNLNLRFESLGRDLKEYKLELEDILKRKNQTIENINRANSEIEKAKEKTTTLEDEKRVNETILLSDRKILDNSKQELEHKISRNRILSDMEDNLDGYNKSVKMVLNESKNSNILGSGILGALAQLIKVERKFESAIEMSLGGALQNIVTKTEEEAKNAINYLKVNKIGRATFLPISSVKPRSLDNVTINKLSMQKGFCGVASDLLEYDSQIDGIVKNLLGKVVIVENLDCGINISRQFRYSFKVVTLDGDVLNPGGSMSGGSKNTRIGGILGRNREIKELEEDIKSLEKVVNEKKVIIEKLEKKINEFDRLIENEEIIIRNSELILIRDESHLNQITENEEKYNAKNNIILNDIKEIETKLKVNKEEKDMFSKELNSINNEIENLNKIVSDNQLKHKEEQNIKENLNKDISDFRVAVGSIKENILTINETIEKIEKDITNLLDEDKEKQNELKNNFDQLNILKEQKLQFENNVIELKDEKGKRDSYVVKILEDKKDLEKELKDKNNDYSATNKRIYLLQEDFNRIEFRKEKLDNEIVSLQNKLWDEYETTYLNALENKIDIGSLSKAQNTINSLKVHIKNLGHVNVASIDEYVNIKERYEFINEQKKDMEVAKEKLRVVIKDITGKMKENFIKQFSLINENFNKVFYELFEGGRAELKLVDENNVLESGIDIIVQPPGKKLQNMMLLSGGERAFTAIALLFSILRLKPTPFCVLDEIEAALDDANVNRFGFYLKRFISNTQFIVITHRKGTMESSDSIYGVTMEEHGVSKVVSMKLGDKAS